MNHRPIHPPLLLLLIVLLLAGCRPQGDAIMISDVGKEEFLSFGKRTGQQGVKELHLHLEGQLDGSAQLVLLREGRPHHVENLTEGTVDLRWRGDWTPDRVRLHYLPVGAASGTLRVSYRFVD